MSIKWFLFPSSEDFFCLFVKEQNIILQSLKKVVLHFIHFIQCSRFFCRRRCCFFFTVVVVVFVFFFLKRPKMRESVWAQHYTGRSVGAGQGSVRKASVRAELPTPAGRSCPRRPGREAPSFRPCWPESCGCCGLPCTGWHTPGW